MKPLPLVLSFAVFCVALFAGAAVVDRVVPWPDRQQLAVKREAFGREEDRIEVLAVGSSRVLRGFVPEAFDAACAERGLEVRSYNFGVGGAHDCETDHIVRRLLALEPARLRYVLLEYQRPNPYRLREEARLSDRSVFWHSPRQLLTELRHVSASDVPPLRKLEQAWHHLLPTLAHVTGYGRARDLFVRRFGDESAAHERLRIGLEEGRGYEPVLTAEDRARKGEDWRRLDPWGWRRQVARIEAGNERDRRILGVRHLESLARAVEAAGARLLLMVMPGEMSTPEVYRLAEHGALPVPLLGFNRPDVHPALYRFESRYSARYLGPEGARHFSRVLAEELVRVAAGR